MDMTHFRRQLPSLCASVLLLASALSTGAANAQPAPAAASADGASWKVDQAERPLAAGSSVQETVWSTGRPPGGPFDKIAVHRYRAKAAGATNGGAAAPVATLLYLPGTNMNGIARLTDEAHNLWVYLANRGVEVFAIDYRTRFIPPDTPPTGLASLRTWGVDAFTADIAAAAALARKESGREKLFVAGFSRGVFLAYAYAGTEFDKVAGLIVLDGPFKNHAPKGQFDAAAGLAKLESAGTWGTDVSGSLGWDNRQKLMDTVAANPDAPASDAKFKTIGDQLANVLQFAWRPGGLANPQGGMSRPRTLATLLGGYDRYYPTVQDVDGRSIADYDDDPKTPVDDKWGELKLPILLFASTGMGGDFLLNAIYSADKSGSTDVTLNVLERYGHLDVLVGDHAQKDVFEPTIAWLKARAK
jgi:pimeloyl-ACP methyl ester carboxylesterase